MSYCCWTSSDIYLYTRNKCITCFKCQLELDKPSNRTFFRRSKALEHVKLHLAFGDNIPQHVVDKLLNEIKLKGDNIEQEL